MFLYLLPTLEGNISVLSPSLVNSDGPLFAEETFLLFWGVV